MAPEESPIPQPSGSLLLPPLLIALGIILAVSLTLLSLHFLLKMLRSRNPPIANQELRGGVINKEVLELLPIQAYCKDHKFLLPEHRRECSVCLTPLEDGVSVRILPACRHVFHCECIDAWFAAADHASCPFCRTEINAPVSLVVSVDDAIDCPSGSMSFREKLCSNRSYNMSCNCCCCFSHHGLFGS